MKNWVAPAGLAALFCISFSAFAQGDLTNAPPAFETPGGRVVPIDFQAYELALNFDVTQRKATGLAKILFVANEEGYPMLDLVPNQISSVKLDGKELGPQGLALTTDPDRQSNFRVLGGRVAPRAHHTLEIQYQLDPKDVTFEGSGVRFGLFMTDLSPRGYLEKFAPANFEFDQFPMKLTFALQGTQSAHQIFTNGDIVATPDGGAREIQFPPYFTSSSFYFHLTSGQETRTAVYKGLERQIPVVAYGRGPDATLKIALETLAVNETTFGPFPHKTLVLYGTSPLDGGMEYCGATMTATSQRVIAHELTHSWFARGVMPANGNAGWMDEAIASWHDAKYNRGDGTFSGSSVNLAGFSPYRRHTPMEAYQEGAWFMSQLDGAMARSGGLRPVLNQLSQTRTHTVITTPFFEQFVTRISNLNLTDQFQKFVYGKAMFASTPDGLSLTGEPETEKDLTPFRGFHPRPYTDAELAILR